LLTVPLGGNTWQTRGHAQDCRIRTDSWISQQDLQKFVTWLWAIVSCPGSPSLGRPRTPGNFTNATAAQALAVNQAGGRRKQLLVIKKQRSYCGEVSSSLQLFTAGALTKEQLLEPYIDRSKTM
jgi:hypothetical protein